MTENITTTIFMDTIDLRNAHKSKYNLEFNTLIMANNKAIIVNDQFIHNVFLKYPIGTQIYLQKKPSVDAGVVTSVFKNLNDLRMNSYVIRSGTKDGTVTILNYSFPYTYYQDISGYDEYSVEDTSFILTRIRNKFLFKDDICYEFKLSGWHPTQKYVVGDFFKNGKQYIEFDDTLEMMNGWCDFKVLNDDVGDFSLSDFIIKLPRKFQNVTGYNISNLSLPDTFINITDETFEIELYDMTKKEFVVSAKSIPILLNMLTSSGTLIINNNALSISSGLPFSVKPSRISKLLGIKENVLNTNHVLNRKNYLYMINSYSRNMSSNGVNNIFGRIENGSIVNGGGCEFKPTVKELSELRFNFVDAEGKAVNFTTDSNFTFNLQITESIGRLL